MSVYSKKDGRGSGAPGKPDSKPPKLPAPSTYKHVSARPAPVPQQAPPQTKKEAPATTPEPAVVVTRMVQIGGSPSQGTGGPPPPRSRPAMPAISIGPPVEQTARAQPNRAASETRTRTQTQRMPSAPPPPARPTAPDMAAPVEENKSSIADTFERLLSAEDLDEGFASIERKSSPPSSGRGVAPTDLAEVRTLFAQLATNHVRQVRDFMLDLRWSEATVDWIAICRPAMRSLRRAAEKLELADLCEALDQFDEALAAAQAAGTTTITGPLREALLMRYLELSEVMPQAFALDGDRKQREAVILQALLLQVPTLNKIAVDKLYAAGLTTLEAMVLATPGDIVATTGIEPAVAEHVVQRFRAYRDEVKEAVPDATRKQERERIADLTKRLRTMHDEHERAAQSWTREAEDRKKELRKAREQTVLEIQVLLARLGEMDRLKELERLPFERKLAHLEAFLEEAQNKYLAQP